MRPRIFLGSSREAIQVCRAVQVELEDEFDVTVWDQDVFRLSHGALESLLDALDSSDAGVFVLRPDDVTISRGEASDTPRDNVIFELGMFIGRLGRDRTFMLTPRGFATRMPSDLLGLTTAHYDMNRFALGQHHPAVAPACTKIRQAIAAVKPRMTPKVRSQERLDRAMRRMSRDLERLLGNTAVSQESSGEPSLSKGGISLQLGRAKVYIETGRIQNYLPGDSGAIALPANEYFDDECISDKNSSLGAFVQHHFRESVDDLRAQIQARLVDVPSQRVPRAERRLDDSYGIGEAIFIDRPPVHRLILVSATTERTGIGLRAEPHFLYAAVEGLIEAMNERRLNSLTMPVLGAGHGGMPLPTAILFNLLAVRTLLDEDLGRHMREIRIVVFEGNAAEVPIAMTSDIMSRLTSL